MVSMRSLILLLASMTLGCTLINAPSTHTQGRGRDLGIDAAVADAPLPDAPLPPDVGFDAPVRDAGVDAFCPREPRDAGLVQDTAIDAGGPPPRLRVAHLARQTVPIDVYANGVLITAGLRFSFVGMPGDVPSGSVDFRVTRRCTDEMLFARTLTIAPGRNYTLRSTEMRSASLHPWTGARSGCSFWTTMPRVLMTTFDWLLSTSPLRSARANSSQSPTTGASHHLPQVSHSGA